MSSLRSAWPAAASLIILAGCAAGLSSSLKRRVADEHAALLAAAKSVQLADQTLQHNLASDRSLFQSTPEPARWSASVQDAHRTLHTAEETDRELAMLAGRNRAEASTEVDRLLIKEKTLRQTAVGEAQAAVQESGRWIGFRSNLQANLERLSADHAALADTNDTELKNVVAKAGDDWPAKKDILRERLERIEEVPKTAESAWLRSSQARDDAAHGTISGAELATLIEASDTLTTDRHHLAKESDELHTSIGQLYDSWDKILVDLDRNSRNNRERIRTVRTHFVDVAAKQTETSSSEQWIDVSAADYQSVEDDLGMAIAHKDAGQFDSEAVGTPEPAGFAYIAPEAQGSNQYGYWAHDGGHSVWTWLPQYLILRELLWNHAYRPVVLEDYRGYQTAQRAGNTYFGRAAATPTASPTPEYGTRGAFTRTTYASSRYVQSGGFKESAYGSHGMSASHSIFGDSHQQAHSDHVWSNGSAGKRFGTGAAPSSGRRFGRSGPSRGFGRSFGRRR